jgi:hypothetical protein
MIVGHGGWPVNRDMGEGEGEKRKTLLAVGDTASRGLCAA